MRIWYRNRSHYRTRLNGSRLRAGPPLCYSCRPVEGTFDCLFAATSITVTGRPINQALPLTSGLELFISFRIVFCKNRISAPLSNYCRGAFDIGRPRIRMNEYKIFFVGDGGFSHQAEFEERQPPAKYYGDKVFRWFSAACLIYFSPKKAELVYTYIRSR